MPLQTTSRRRASVACAACRDRRAKCVVEEGQTKCGQCQRRGIECALRQEDGRRAPSSKAHVDGLQERLDLLESRLVHTGQSVPPPQIPTNTTNATTTTATLPSPGHQKQQRPPTQQRSQSFGATSMHSASRLTTAPAQDMNWVARQPLMGVDISDSGSENNTPASIHDSVLPLAWSERASTSPARSDGSKGGLVDKLLTTSGHLSFDQTAGCMRYFGPTTNLHIYSDLINLSSTHLKTREPNQRAGKIIRELSVDTYDHLMACFWTFHNSILHVVHKEAFYRDKESGGSKFYSTFLHICILAIGYRFADKSRADIQKLALAPMMHESTLHKEAKRMFEHEMEEPGGLPSIQALLLLGDLECGCGRDNTGWMYAGMACRLSFDNGLNLECDGLGLSQEEIQIRHMVLWACTVYDKYWALYLGRTTTIKSSDIDILQITDGTARLGTCLPSGPEKSLETLVYQALLDLMDIAGKITESRDVKSASADHQAYRRVAALDGELTTWHKNLPLALRWTPNNIGTAPSSFFLLHQQYHSTLILLHRPFTHNEEPKPSQNYRELGSRLPGHVSQVSRAICFDNAVHVARIFKRHCHRFDAKSLCLNALQHAGTAATALIASIALIKDPKDRVDPLRHLDCLMQAISAMSSTYQPAERMSNVLNSIISETKWVLDDVQEPDLRPTIPARRASDSQADISQWPPGKHQFGKKSGQAEAVVFIEEETNEPAIHHPDSPDQQAQEFQAVSPGVIGEFIFDSSSFKPLGPSDSVPSSEMNLMGDMPFLNDYEILGLHDDLTDSMGGVHFSFENPQHLLDFETQKFADISADQWERFSRGLEIQQP